MSEDKRQRDPDKKRVLMNFKLPPGLVRRMRRRADRNNVTLTSVVENALRRYLKPKVKPKRRRSQEE